MVRLVQADLLKLRRRRGMLAVVASLVLGSVALYYGIGALLGADSTFADAVAILTLLASVAGAAIGATAGGQDLESGVFRDLVATGRDRGALFAARVPAAWALTLGLLAVALAGAALVSTPPAGEVARGAATVFVSGALAAAVCVGLASLTGRSGQVMGFVLAFQLGLAPLLAQLDVLGQARLAIPAVAISRLDNADGLVAALPVAGAIGIILAWAAAALGAGLWRTRTQET